MITPVFSEKLDRLNATLELFGGYDPEPLADALAAGGRRHAITVGSGGSTVAAEYLAVCRDTLGLGPTTVQTPMQTVLARHDLKDSEVWLFSASADNADAVATARAALDRGASGIHLLTRNPGGAAAEIVACGGGVVHVVPVGEPKDGYLATHSLVASLVALLLAGDVLSGEPGRAVGLLYALEARVADMRGAGVRDARSTALSGLRRTDTIVVAADPNLRPLAALLDTSIWEAALCHVQTTDLRNLAHGRHAWLHHRDDETRVLALTGIESRATWNAIGTALPTSLLRSSLDYGACGRLDNALAVLDGFGLIEAIGGVVGIDPGKPGFGDFGRSMYSERSLAERADALSARTRRKRAAMATADADASLLGQLGTVGRDRLEALAEAAFGGAVFDYDGTIVATWGRWTEPDQAIVGELVRLHGAGLVIGFATGRGGSAGEDLRKVLPSAMLPSVVIGYYNGTHVRTADIDVDLDSPPADPAITETAQWLDGRTDLFVRYGFKHRHVQITVEKDRLRSPRRFAADMEGCPAVADGRVRVGASGHSYDIVPAAASKLAVVDALRSRMPASTEVLRIGDSGSRSGNDHALLSHHLGISVGDVCGRLDGTWSLFGVDPIGPAALLRILRALVPDGRGIIRLDVAAMGLDANQQSGT